MRPAQRGLAHRKAPTTHFPLTGEDMRHLRCLGRRGPEFSRERQVLGATSAKMWVRRNIRDRRQEVSPDRRGARVSVVVRPFRPHDFDFLSFFLRRVGSLLASRTKPARRSSRGPAGRPSSHRGLSGAGPCRDDLMCSRISCLSTRKLLDLCARQRPRVLKLQLELARRARVLRMISSHSCARRFPQLAGSLLSHRENRRGKVVTLPSVRFAARRASPPGIHRVACLRRLVRSRVRGRESRRFERCARVSGSAARALVHRRAVRLRERGIGLLPYDFLDIARAVVLGLELRVVVPMRRRRSSTGAFFRPPKAARGNLTWKLSSSSIRKPHRLTLTYHLLPPVVRPRDEFCSSAVGDCLATVPVLQSHLAEADMARLPISRGT